MDRAIVYQRLAEGLLECGIRFRADNIAVDDVNVDTDRLARTVRSAADWAPVLVNLAGLNAPDGVFALTPMFEPQKVQERLDHIRQFASIVGYKYWLAQPLVVAVVEADGLDAEQITDITHRFDELVLQMTDSTLEIMGTKGSVTGIVLYVFFDAASASRVGALVRDKGKVTHFWKKANVLPWIVDVEARQVRKHSGIPIIANQFLSADVLSRTVFAP